MTAMRRWLHAVKVASAASALVALLSQQVLSAGIIMRIAGAPGAGDIRYEATSCLERELPNATGGKVKVEVHKGTMGGEREILERLSLGTLEGYMGSTGSLESLTGAPIASLYDVPFLFRDWDHLYKVAQSDLGTQIKNAVGKRGIHILDYVSRGTRAVYTRNRPIRTAQDLAGLKIRVMENPVYIAMYKEFGALPVPMAWTEIYTAMQTGVLDAVDGSLSSGLAAKHTETAKYVTLLGNYVVIASILAVSDSWWQKLPGDVHQAIEKIAHSCAVYEQKKNEDFQSQLMESWKKAGIQFTEPDRAQMEQVARRVYPMVEKRMGAAAIERVRQLGAK